MQGEAAVAAGDGGLAQGRWAGAQLKVLHVERWRLEGQRLQRWQRWQVEALLGGL